MAGFRNSGVTDVVYADNVDFSGAAIPSPSVTTDGQLLIGSSVAPNIRVATISAGTGISVTNGHGTISIASTGVETISGDTGSVTGSTITFNANSNCGSSVVFAGSGSTISLKVTDGSLNTIIGELAGNSSLSGGYNTVFGFGGGASFTSAAQNILLGYAPGSRLLTGQYNILIGNDAGYNYTGAESSNIILANYTAYGTSGESNVLRIGNGTGSGSGQQNKAFISGIQTIVVTGTPVLVSGSDQLGIAASSSQFKSDIQDMGDTSNIMKLRPVTFVWNKDSSPGLKDAPDDRQYGLISEEVHEAFPYLCSYDKEGVPFSVKYNELPSILLNELQKALKRIEALEARL